ncbi:MAG: hypothetical protein FJ213_11015 [Ignavibacteria bacterium]|nr:hypothetical protein [Ignavibacteria bacterium]
MKDFFALITILSIFSLGIDYFAVISFERGSKLVPSSSRAVTFKSVLGWAIYSVSPVKSAVTVLPLIAISFIIFFQMEISLLWWIGLFLQFGYGIYFVGYIYPKMRRFANWDLRNPIAKWESLYSTFAKANSFLLIFGTLVSILLCVAFFLS